MQLPAAGKTGGNHLSGTILAHRLERHSADAPHRKLQNPNLKYPRNPLHSHLVLDAWFLKFPVRNTGSTALHAGKDLVVAPPSRDGIIPRGNSRPFGFDVTVGTSILADDRRYLLPIFSRTRRKSMSGLSSLTHASHVRASGKAALAPCDKFRAIAWPGPARSIPQNRLWIILLPIGLGHGLYL